jgi:hypothetical protein
MVFRQSTEVVVPWITHSAMLLPVDGMYGDTADSV